MKYVDEFQEAPRIHRLISEIERIVTRRWTIMEVCGGQTHSIVRHGIDQLLPLKIEIVHGPGCPVCVTPLEMIDKAHAIASRPDAILCSFGDMLRVPGSRTDLLRLKSQGADVRVIYSPMDCLRIARKHPDKKVVFFAIGFETTAPANATALWQARKIGIQNFFLLVSHVRVPPALAAILQAPGNRVQGFLGPGHVCTIMGFTEYEALSAHYKVPIVITGFEPFDIVQGVLMVVRQLEEGRAEVENQYARVVRAEGNPSAQNVVFEVFEVADQTWRGVGRIPKSGYRLRREFREHDAVRIFKVGTIETRESPLCLSGQILQGLKKPQNCPAFAKECNPEHPLGATMVSAEGACAAYYNYGRHLLDPLVRATE